MTTIKERRSKAAGKRIDKGKKPFTNTPPPPKDAIIPDPRSKAGAMKSSAHHGDVPRNSTQLSDVEAGFKKAAK